MTVPRGVTSPEAVAFLAAKRPWVLRALERTAEKNAHHAGGTDALPERIEFPAVGESWTVEYRHTASPTVRVLRAEAPVRGTGGRGRIVVSGAIPDPAACVRALNRFVDARAREVLPAELASAAESHRLQLPTAVTVRHQRTRWGSCSTTGAISLNRTLLFLPRDLAISVMLHELVHLVHHDHSAAFWDALERVDPQAREKRREMRDAWRVVPPWASAPHPRSNGDT